MGRFIKNLPEGNEVWDTQMPARVEPETHSFPLSPALPSPWGKLLAMGPLATHSLRPKVPCSPVLVLSLGLGHELW